LKIRHFRKNGSFGFKSHYSDAFLSGKSRLSEMIVNKIVNNFYETKNCPGICPGFFGGKHYEK